MTTTTFAFLFRSTLPLAAVIAVTAAPRIAHADPPSTPTPASAPTVPAAVPAAPAAAPADARPVIELHADDARATLEKRAGTSSYAGLPFAEASLASVSHWEEACAAPCVVRVDPHATYRVSGDGLVPTSSFPLPAGADRVRVDAKMGSATARVAGIALTTLGVAGVVVGGAAAASTPLLESEDVGSKGFRTAVLAGGVAVLAGGAVALGTGLVLWLSNGSSARPGLGAALAKTAARGGTVAF